MAELAWQENIQMGHRHYGGRTMEKVFISYKSENAGTVRRIVDLLIANYLDVWFAEYKVLASNYDDFQKRVDGEITSAIATSTHAIIFTNHRWNMSEYCRLEYTQIRAQMSSDKIIQVCLPKEQTPPLALQSEGNLLTIIHDPENTMTTVLFILNHIQSSHARTLAQEMLTPIREPHPVHLRFGEVNTGRLRQMPIAARYGPVAKQHSARFFGYLDTLPVQLDIVYNPYSLPVAEEYLADPAESAANDDRQLYTRLRGRARKWYRRTEYDQHGLHLLARDNGVHLGMTHCSVVPNNVHEWQRVYSLFLRDKSFRKPVTVTFTFVANIPVADEAESFRRFCGIVSYFEDIVESFVFRSDPCLQYLPTRQSVRVKQILATVLGAGIGYLVYHRLESLLHLAPPFAVAFIVVGATIGSILFRQFAFAMYVFYINLSANSNARGSNSTDETPRPHNRAEAFAEQGYLTSACLAYEMALAEAAGHFPKLVPLAAYNYGQFLQHSMGDGVKARELYLSVLTEKGIPAELEANTCENLLSLSLSCGEFCQYAERIVGVQPGNNIVRDLWKDVQEHDERGDAWADQMIGLARLFSDPADPSAGERRYGDSASTYQLMIEHRDELRLSRAQYSTAVVSYGAALYTAFAVCHQRMETSGGAVDPNETTPIIKKGIGTLELYLAKQGPDAKVETMLQSLKSLLQHVKTPQAVESAGHIRDQGAAPQVGKPDPPAIAADQPNNDSLLKPKGIIGGIMALIAFGLVGARLVGAFDWSWWLVVALALGISWVGMKLMGGKLTSMDS
jgi:hypothetical protein